MRQRVEQKLSLYDRVLDFVFPPKCPFCGGILADSLAQCKDCQLPWTADTGEQCFYTPEGLLCCSAVWYQTLTARAIKRYKFSGARHYAPYFGRLMAEALAEGITAGFDCITWVPLSKSRRWARGYNQAELLARVVAEELGYEPRDLLLKVKHNVAQTSLDSDEARRLNTQGVYRLQSQLGSLENKRILLVDDVVTTGSSLYASGTVLLEAGVGEVVCLTFARARK